MVTLQNDAKMAIQNEIVQFIDAENMLELFPSPPDVGDITLEQLVWRYLKDVAEASLTTRGWSPNKTKMEVNKFAHRLFSAGLESNLEFRDWKIFEKIGVREAGFGKIGKKPAKQMSHYFFTGLRLLDSGLRAPRPVATNFNFIVEAGTGNGTLGRPLQVGNAAGGLWGLTTAFIDAIDLGIGSMVSKGFNKSSLLYFYPKVAEKVIIHKVDSGGSGLYSPRQHLIESGISENRIIATDNVYLPTDPTGTPVAPTLTDFDSIFVDAAEVRIMYTERPFANVYTPNPGSAKPNLTIETGLTACPLFIPKEIKSEAKIYKGVYIINGATQAAV